MHSIVYLGEDRFFNYGRSRNSCRTFAASYSGFCVSPGHRAVPFPLGSQEFFMTHHSNFIHTAGLVRIH